LLELLDRTKRSLGEHHPFRGNVMRELGCALRAMGRNEEAVAMMEICRDGFMCTTGGNHPFTVTAKDCVVAWQNDISLSVQDNDAVVETAGGPSIQYDDRGL
jgi:hypothetical protein